MDLNPNVVRVDFRTERTTNNLVGRDRLFSTGTNLATAIPRLEMIISSPSSTRDNNLENWDLALWIVNVSITIARN
jgi:hypothetical protein